MNLILCVLVGAACSIVFKNSDKLEHKIVREYQRNTGHNDEHDFLQIQNLCNKEIHRQHYQSGNVERGSDKNNYAVFDEFSLVDKIVSQEKNS